MTFVSGSGTSKGSQEDYVTIVLLVTAARIIGDLGEYILLLPIRFPDCRLSACTIRALDQHTSTNSPEASKGTGIAPARHRLTHTYADLWNLQPRCVNRRIQ